MQCAVNSAVQCAVNSAVQCAVKFNPGHSAFAVQNSEVKSSAVWSAEISVVQWRNLCMEMSSGGEPCSPGERKEWGKFCAN